MEENSPTPINVVVIEIAKLDLKPGQVLALICPEEWTPRQQAMYVSYFSHIDPIPHIPKIFLPHGFELTVVSPPERFGTNNGGE